MSDSVLHFSVKTLTPLHIGSGRELQSNYEYLYFPSYKKIALVQESKVLDILGEGQLGQWISIIDKEESLLELLQERKKDLAPIDIAQRIMEVGDKALESQGAIREQMHDGMGYPLLPGSSLKGSMRTAFVSQKIRKAYAGTTKVEKNKLGRPKRNDPSKFQWKDNGLENDLLVRGVGRGKEPNHDVFRLIRLGDIRFSHTEVFRLNSLNKHHKGWIEDSNISHLIEAIPANQDGYLRLSVPKETLLSYLASERLGFSFPVSPSEVEWKNLSYLINTQSQRALKKEIAFWEAEDSTPLTAMHVESLKELYQRSQGLPEGCCILQVGFGSGINGITGAWQEETMKEEDYKEWMKSFRRSAPQLAFPKTRKLSPSGHSLGYILLEPLSPSDLSTFNRQLEDRRTQHLKAEQKRIEPEKIVPQYPAKPQRIKKGSLLDAFVFEKQTESKRKRIHVYVKKEGNPELFIPYPSNVIVGKIIEVEVRDIQNGKVSQVSFKRIKQQNRKNP